MGPNGARPPIIGADSGPEAPYPLRMKGAVVSGFGRGSKEVSLASPPPLVRFLARGPRPVLTRPDAARHPHGQHPRRLRPLDLQHRERRVLRLGGHPVAGRAPGAPGGERGGGGGGGGAGAEEEGGLGAVPDGDVDWV